MSDINNKDNIDNEEPLNETENTDSADAGSPLDTVESAELPADEENNSSNSIENPAAATFNTEGSTIFTAPAVSEDKKSSSDTAKFRRNIILFVAGLLVLGAAALAVIFLIPESAEDPAASSSGPSATMLINLATDKIDKVSITNQADSFTAYPTLVATESDGTDIKWNLENVDSTLVDRYSLGTTVSNAAVISATRVMAESANDLSVYGLDKPTITVKIIGKDSADSVTLLIGSDAPAGGGCYAMLEGRTTVYLLDSLARDNFSKDKLYYINRTFMNSIASDEVASSYFQDSTLKYFDMITVTGKNFPQPIEMVKSSASGEAIIPYVMTKPISQNLNEDAVKALMAPLLSGLTGDGAYAIQPTAADLKTYGMDDPLAIITYKVDKITRVLKISNGPDKNYYTVMVDGRTPIYKMEKAYMPYAEKQPSDYFSTYMLLENITTIKSVTFKTASSTKIYNLTHSKGEDDVASFTVSSDGKELDEANFRNLYQQLLSVTAAEFTTEKATGTPTLTVTLDFIDDAKPEAVMIFTKQSDRRYHITVNGSPLGFAYSTAVENIMQYNDDYYNGKAVPEWK